MKAKAPRPEFIKKLEEVVLTKGQEEVLSLVLRDRTKKDNHKFFRARDVIFEALVRQHLGDAEYSKLVASASEKAKTMVMLAKQMQVASQKP